VVDRSSEDRTYCKVAIISDHPPLDLSQLKRGQPHHNFALKNLTRRDPRLRRSLLFGSAFDELGGQALVGRLNVAQFEERTGCKIVIIWRLSAVALVARNIWTPRRNFAV
jgi:hypothetical protein